MVGCGGYGYDVSSGEGRYLSDFLSRVGCGGGVKLFCRVGCVCVGTIIAKTM